MFLLRQGWRSSVILLLFGLSAILSFIPSVSRITHDRGNGRRPNKGGTGKG